MPRSLSQEIAREVEKCLKKKGVTLSTMPRTTSTEPRIYRPNRLKQLKDKYNFTIQDLTARWEIGGATINSVLNHNYYPPSEDTRTRIIRAVSEVTGIQFTDADIWPEADCKEILK